jgi:hypothetical protein
LKKILILFSLFFLSFSLFSLDMETIQKKITGGSWVQPQKAYNQLFYYSFNENKTGYVYYTQNGKKIGEYNITYKLEDTFLIITTPGGDIIWEITAITDSILVIKNPGSTTGETLRRASN